MKGTNLSPLPPSRWPARLDDMATSFAAPLNVYRLMAHNPDLLRAWAPLREHIVSARALGAERQEVVVLRIAHRLRSDYEAAHHRASGRDEVACPAPAGTCAPSTTACRSGASATPGRRARTGCSGVRRSRTGRRTACTHRSHVHFQYRHRSQGRKSCRRCRICRESIPHRENTASASFRRFAQLRSRRSKENSQLPVHYQRISEGGSRSIHE